MTAEQFAHSFLFEKTYTPFLRYSLTGSIQSGCAYLISYCSVSCFGKSGRQDRARHPVDERIKRCDSGGPGCPCCRIHSAHLSAHDRHHVAIESPKHMAGQCGCHTASKAGDGSREHHADIRHILPGAEAQCIAAQVIAVIAF